MEKWKIGIFPNDVVNASKVKITKTGTANSISIKQSSMYLGSKNTSTNENICKTCNTRCLGHVGVIEVFDPVTHKKQPVFRPFFNSTSFVKKFLKLVCPICCNVNSIQMSQYLNEAHKYYPNLPSSLKARFLKDLPNLMKRKARCGQPNCSEVYSGFKYNQGSSTKKNNYQGMFSYEHKDKIVVLSFERTYDLFVTVCSKAFILLVNDHYFDVRELFFTDGIPVSSTTARHAATFNNNAFELFAPFYKSLVDYSDKILHANKNELLNLQISFAKILNSSITKPLSTYSVKPTTPSIAVYTIGNDKHSLLNHKLIGGPKYPSGSAVASANSDGEITKVQMSRSLAKGFLVSDICCMITRDKVIQKLQQGCYRYLIRAKKDKNLIFNMTDQSKIDVQDGDMLLRYIDTGDCLIMTRFPTLSRYSRVAFEAEIVEDDQDMTIRVPIPVVVMYNLDFDGDKVFINTVFNSSSKVDLIARLSVNACMMNEMTGAHMPGVVQENQICLNTVLRMKNIPKRTAHLLMDRDLELLEEDKDFYTGRELISYFIPSNVTYPGFIEDGVIIIKQLTGKQLGANSINSLFTALARCVSAPISIKICESLNSFGYRFAYYHGFCIRIDHLIPDYEKYIQMRKSFDKIYKQYEQKVKDKVAEIEARQKVTNSNMFYREMESVLSAMTQVTNELLHDYMKDFKDVSRDYDFENDDLNYFIEMLHQKLKISESGLATIYIARGQIKEPSTFQPGVNGKTTILSSSLQITPDSIGYSATCHIIGATYIEMVIIIDRVATVQFQDLTQKTADMGTSNKKQLKYFQFTKGNTQRNVTNGNVLITVIANEVGVLPKDLCKIIIDKPPNNLVNYELAEYYYNEIEDLLTYVDKDKGRLVKKECSFFYHPYSFIRMYNDTNPKDIEEYNPSLDIIEFWTKIRHDFYFMMRPVTDLIYISLLYFDPSKAFLQSFIPEGHKPDIRITKGLWDRFKLKITELLTYSFTSSFNGVQCATAIQAVTTQQALSAHQPVSRMGTTINSNFVNEYLSVLRMKDKATDILTIHTPDIETVNQIYRQFRYVTLNTLESTISLEKNVVQNDATNTTMCRCTIVIPILMLQYEKMNVSDVWKMLSYNFSSLSYLNLFTIEFEIDKINCTATVDIQFNTQDGSFIKHMTQLEIDLKSFNKGRENNFLEIQDLPDGNYKIEMELTSLSDFSLINTKNITYMKIPLAKTHLLGNLKIHSSVRNELVELTDSNLLFAYQTLADAQYSTRVIKPLSMKPDNNKIFTSSTLDSTLNFAESAIKGYTDNCYSIESSSFKGKASRIGRPQYDFCLDPFVFGRLEIKSPINDILTEVPIEIL